MASRRSSDQGADSPATDETEDAAVERTASDPKRPSDHFDTPAPTKPDPGITQPRLGLVGTARFFWRQLTSMRTALLLLLLVAFAAVPGSLVPQVTSDPNGVIQYKAANPGLSRVLDFLGVFNTYTSVWFSAIYLLLFISLVGCIIPRTKHHFDALRAAPPRTPARLDRLAGFRSTENAQASDADIETTIGVARDQLRKAGYRTRVFDGRSVSAERGYLRETGNLIFHVALVGILAVVGFGGGFIYTGQKVVVVGQGFANTLSDYDSISPGRWFDPDALTPYSLQLTKFSAVYESKNVNAYGEAIDYTAYVKTTVPGQAPKNETIKVNSPLRVGDTDVYLLGNGYAPVITVRDPNGNIVFSQPEPFLAQDANLTSNGVVKIPIGLAKQVGILGFFYPTACSVCGTNLSSVHPDLLDPELTLQVYTGDLGLNTGQAINAFSLDKDKLTQLDGFGTGKAGITLKPGQTAQLPNGLGSVSLDRVVRYASLDIHHDPTQLWVLAFAILVFLGLITGLFVPRRRVWVKAVEGPTGVHYEYAGLARGEDPRLDDAVAEIARKHSQQRGLTMKP
jgi:cytochrome c biogenesis protein